MSNKKSKLMGMAAAMCVVMTACTPQAQASWAEAARLRADNAQRIAAQTAQAAQVANAEAAQIANQRLYETQAAQIASLQAALDAANAELAAYRRAGDIAPVLGLFGALCAMAAFGAAYVLMQVKRAAQAALDATQLELMNARQAVAAQRALLSMPAVRAALGQQSVAMLAKAGK